MVYFQNSLTDASSVIAAAERGPSLAASTAAMGNTQTSGDGTTTAALGDGCYHVFIDAESNRGVHGRLLLEPGKYPLSNITTMFDGVFGPDRDKQNICVFAFEPNDRHAPTQTATQEAYRKMGWRYHYMPFGVGDEDTQLTFYRNQDYLGGDENEEWGFATSLTGSKENAKTVIMNVIDLAKWSEKHIFSRKLPEKNAYNQGPPKVSMKLDVEGLEFKVLYRMDQLGTTCKFDHLFGERHVHEYPQIFGPHSLTTKKKMRQYGFQLLKAMHLRPNCPDFLMADEEAYIHDGMPYPEPPKS
jgi:hypothetical protein